MDKSLTKKEYKKTLNIFIVIASISMLASHCRFYISFYFPTNSLPLSNLTGLNIYWYLLGLLTMCFPCLAGANLYLRLSSLLDYNQLDKQWLKSFIAQTSFILLIDPIKNILTTGFYTIIRWDILIFIFSTMIYITFLKIYLRKTLSVLFLTLGLCIFFQLTKSHILKFIFIEGQDLSLFFNTPLSTIYMIMSLIAFSAYLLSFTFKVKIAIARPFIVFATILFVINYFEYWTVNHRFAASMTNMPLAALYNIKLIGGHIWSFFPWVLLPVLGFFWCEISVNHKKKTKFLNCLALLYFLYFLYYLYPEYVKLQDSHRVHSSNIYTTNIATVIGIFSFFVVVYQVIEKLKSFIPNLNIAGSSILFFYFTHHVIAYWFAPYFAKLVPSPTLSYLSYTLFTLLVTYGLTLIIGYLYQSRIILFSRKL